LIIIDNRRQEGNKSDIWFNGQVTIRSASYYRLHIEAVIGNRKMIFVEVRLLNSFICLGTSHEGDTAIDDLRIFDSPCVLTPADADPASLPSTTTSTQPSTTSPPGQYDCTFENGICNGWANMANNTFDWMRLQASITSLPGML
jgi:hypothetical protein